MSNGPEDEYVDVLQNIEYAIVSAARGTSEADDHDVMHALDLMVKDFRDIERGREPKSHSLDGAEQAIYQNLMAICRWRMGQGEEPEGIRSQGTLDAPALSAEVLSRCLKKVRKSVDNWNTAGGSRGYLEFIQPFFPE